MTLSAYKIVEGEKGLMDEIDFTYDGRLGAWASEFQTPRAHGLWAYLIDGDAMTGTLVDLPSKHLIRNIAVHRDPAAPGK